MDFKFLSDLNAELATITAEQIGSEVVSLKTAGEDTSDFVGVLPIELQKLWTLIGLSQKEFLKEFQKVDGKVLRSFSTGGATDINKLLSKASSLNAKIIDLQSFFWMATSSELGVDSQYEIGLRADWKVYRIHPVCQDCGIRHAEKKSKVIGGVGAGGDLDGDLASVLGILLGPEALRELRSRSGLRR